MKRVFCKLSIRLLAMELLPFTRASMQGLLELMRQYTNLQRKKQHIHNLKEPGNHVSLDDRGPLTRAEGVGHWLVHKFGFALIHQGPFCAALILQVRLVHARAEAGMPTPSCAASVCAMLSFRQCGASLHTVPYDSRQRLDLLRTPTSCMRYA